MTTLIPITPKELADRLKDASVTLLDIREPDEFARERIQGAISLPLSKLEESTLTVEGAKAGSRDLVFHCKSGMRTSANCTRLAAHVDGRAFMLEGGLDAWKQSGFKVLKNPKAPLELNRQVQLTIGILLLLGVMLTYFVNPAFLLLPTFLGAGLCLAGSTGWCGMANVLAAMPWNSVPTR